MGYAKNAISGFSWQTVLKGASSVVSLVKIFFLARLLTPDDFGQFSLILIALGVTEALTQTGINITIIQSKQSAKYFLDTAWVIAIVRGFVIGIIMMMLGFGLSKLFADPDLLTYVTVAALVPVIKGFINPMIVSLHKELKFFYDSLYRFGLVFVEAVASIILAYVLHSIWALVFGLIIAALFEVIISFLFFSERPVFHYLSSRASIIFQNAKWLSLASLFYYLNENIDDFLIGKVAGTYNLGLYHNAYALGHKSNTELAKALQHSTLPILTRLVEKEQRLNSAFRRALWATIAISVAASLPTLLFPGLIISILLGPQWSEAIPLVRPLVLAGIIEAIAVIAYGLFTANKQYKILNLHLAVNVSLMVTLVLVLGNQFGVTGAVYGVFLSRLLALPLIWLGIKQAIKPES